MKDTSGGSQADTYVPLPIQSFLWRQTNPFIGGKIGKLHEASCVTFERVVVQNILHGLSPSLSDAIGSISRWRFIQATFPHVLHCCAALLTERSKSLQDSAEKLTQSQIKLLYIVHWMINDAAAECIDADTSKSSKPLTQYLFPLNSIQLFVYLMMPLAHTLKESDMDNIRLESGLPMWRAFWEYRQPESFAFSTPVKPKLSQIQLLPLLKKALNHTAEQDIYMGGELQKDTSGIYLGGPTSPQRKPSLNVTSPSSGSLAAPKPQQIVEPSVEPPKTKVSATQSHQPSEKHEKKKRGAKALIRSISEYRRTTTISIEEVAKHLKYVEDGGSAVIDVSDDAPLVSLQDICGTNWSSFDLPGSSSHCEVICEICNSVVAKDGSLVGVCECRDRNLQHYKVVNLSSNTPETTSSTSSDFDKVTVIEGRDVPTDLQLKTDTHDVTPHSDGQSGPASEAPSTMGTPLTPVQVAPVILRSPVTPDIQVQLTAPSGFGGHSGGRERKFIATSPTAANICGSSDALQASYFDVAVLRCLYIRHWTEPGVFWGLQYFYQRLLEICDATSQHREFRKRSNSVPIPKLKVTFARPSPYQSKTDLDVSSAEGNRRSPTWTQLHPEGDSSTHDFGLTTRAKVAFYEPTEDQKGSDRSRSSIPLDVEGKRSHSPTQDHQPAVRRPSIPAFKHMFGGIKAEPKDAGEKQGLLTESHSIMSFMGASASYPKFRSVEQSNSFFGSLSSVARSATDSNISYTAEMLTEAVGSGPYIHESGNLNLLMVLRALSNVLQRGLSLRVCEASLNLLDLLLDVNILEGKRKPRSSHHNSPCATNRTLINHIQKGSTTPGSAKRDFCTKPITKLSPDGKDPTDEAEQEMMDLMMNTVIKSYQYLGCPHGCSDSMRGPPSDFLRGQARSCLSRLQRRDPDKFSQHMLNLVQKTELSKVVDFIHAFTGFCCDTLSSHRNRSVSHGSQDANKQSKFTEGREMPTYKNNFLSNQKGVEGVVIEVILQSLVTKFSLESSELQQPENMSLFHDIRSFMGYIQENHGSPFRKVALSGLIDAMVEPHKPKIPAKDKSETSLKSDSGHTESDTESVKLASTPQMVHRDSKDVGGLRRGLFKSKKDRTVAGVHLGETTDEEEYAASCPATPRHKTLLVTDDNTTASASSLVPTSERNKRKSSKLQIALNKLKAVKSETQLSSGQQSQTEESEESSDPDHSVEENLSSVGKKKSPKRISFKGAASGIALLSKMRQGKKISTESSPDLTEPKPKTEATLVDQLVIPPRNMVNIKAVLDGAQRFSFMLETCQPGSAPDAGLLAALLDLRAPVIARATIFLECCNFVHRCNKGMWPDWIHSGAPAPMGRMSMPPLGNRGTPSGVRKANLMQRTAGKMFFQWAETIGQRLEELLREEKVTAESLVQLPNEEVKKKQLRIYDDLEDFLDEGTVNPTGKNCPFALKMLAVMLLTEITAFLRETFQFLPRQKGPTKPHGSNWDKLISYRRASVLSSIFNPSQHSGSIQSISNLMEPTFGGERRISFCTQEEESPHSSHSTIEDPTGPLNDRKIRRLAQGRRVLKRGGGLGSGSQHGSSFKRKSVRLKKRDKDDVEQGDVETRQGSVKSRKASTLSDGASAEHEGSVGGDHLTPQQPMEPQHLAVDPSGDLLQTVASSTATSQSDLDEAVYYKEMPWLKTVAKLMNMSNVICSHQKFCHSNCYQRNLRQCHRLVVALRKIYGEEFPLDGQMDRRKAMLENLSDKKQRPSMDRRRRTSSSVTSSTVRRESTQVRGAMTIPVGSASSTLHLRHLIEKLETEESKEKDKSHKKGAASVEDKPIRLRSKSTEHPMLSYINTHLQIPIHSPMSLLLKGAMILPDSCFLDVIPIAWELLLEYDPHLVACAAASFIVSSVKQPEQAVTLMKSDLTQKDPTRRICAVLRFATLWRNRYHCWVKMEDGAHMNFKVPPPGIDFTLPSPPVGQLQQPCVDPPWTPHIKTKVAELTISEEDTTSQTIMTMTKTRRKQKQEFMQRARQQADERRSEERKRYKLLTVPVPQQAAYEPALFSTPTILEDHEDDPDHIVIPKPQQMPVSQPLFPSCLCSVVPMIIRLTDDTEVNADGIAVGEVAKKVIWNCLVEDTALFIRYFLEKLTTRDRQEELMGLLRKLILQFQGIPPQTAYTLLNYLFGFVMYYVRQPGEGTQDAIGAALSLIWLVAPTVYCLFFKDLKTTLKKEQCDAALMVTANVPSAKKIVVHGPDSSTIPSQFPIQEDTIFQTILTDSIDFFNIPDSDLFTYLLIDAKSGVIHNPQSYVRDHYFFRRAFYPQLNLVRFNPDEAALKLKQSGFSAKNVELGKILLTLSMFRACPEQSSHQKVFFLHEELTKLPSFPRKALEASFGLYRGKMGKELHGIDSLHKYSWAMMVGSMLSKMESSHIYGDLHLFINVINGILIVHAEDSAILRKCMATYINMAQHFRALFLSTGFFLIMPTILRTYSQRQSNLQLCEVIEFTCKQFYIMHRKPFILQMFGSIAGLLDCNDDEDVFDPMQVKASHLFLLLKAMENIDNSRDLLEIMSLVEGDKPLKPLDFCYREDPNTFTVLTDVIASCVTICAYAPECRRSTQMLVVLGAILPHFMERVQEDTKKAGGTASALKHELHVLTTLTIEMRALANCCDSLGSHFKGPQRAFDLANVSGRGKSINCESPQPFDIAEDVVVVRPQVSKMVMGNSTTANWEQVDDVEVQREVFRRPRDALLCVAAEFLTNCSKRMKELGKLMGENTKIPELFDQKSHMRLSEVAHSLLKLAPYDPNTMACEGLQKYFLEILPLTDWSQEQSRSALSLILRRLDKTFAKIGKRGGIRRRTNWNCIANWLHGLHQTISNFPYMAHLHFLKTTVQMCLKLVVGDPSVMGGGDDSVSSVTHNATPTVLNNNCPPYNFCVAVIKLTTLLMQALGQQSFSLEAVCSVDSLGSTGDKVERVLCHIMLPMFLRAASLKKGAPQFRQADLTFSLNFMMSAVHSVPVTGAPSTLGPPSATSTHLFKGEAMRTGSVVVSERTAQVPGLKCVSESIYQTVFLGLKIFIITFEKRLSAEWSKIAKCIRELGQKHAGGIHLWNFIEFVMKTNTPLEIVLRPFIENKVINYKTTSEDEAQMQELIKDRLKGNYFSFSESKGTILKELGHELKTLKEELSAKTIDITSRTPTIMADLHSDSSSQHSNRRPSDSKPRVDSSRRLSISSKISRLSPSAVGRSGVFSQEGIAGSTIDDSTIIEEGENETGGDVPAAAAAVSGHLPPHPHLQRRTRSTIRVPKGSQRLRKAKVKAESHGAIAGEGDLGSFSPDFESGSGPVVQFELTPRSFSNSGSMPLKSLKQPVLKRAATVDPQTSTETLEACSSENVMATPKRQGAVRTRSPPDSPTAGPISLSTRADSTDSVGSTSATEKQSLLGRPSNA